MKASPDALSTLVDTRRVLVTVGAGGVGKTTTAAALSVAAARRGKRVLCLTIDPAKRLAESLGIVEMTTEAATVDPARFAAAGVPISGSLTAMMLDTKRTFDELVIKYSSSRDKADKLLSNKLYQYVSTSLAGTQEYMAMEKLVAVKEDPRYDLIVLDTPPTANALDFLDAPERLIEALDSATMKWFVEAFQSSGKFSLNLIAKSAATVLRVIGKITGGGFLEAMAEFIAELNDLFGGFKERASRVQQTLRADDVAFILVTSPSPPAIREVLYFAERLEESKMPRGALVVNRFHLPPPFSDRGVTVADAAKGCAERGLVLDDDAPERLVHAHGDAVKIAALDASHVQALTTSAGGLPTVRVAELETDVHDIALLAKVSDVLMTGGV
ncbi:MAG TPA: ArsA-related P-loop ATPase [Labilithrix sp.]|jgi:anion-transporting  ArsA/GET3 family ATPase|nr:ArsA-related P-loop ATPase [Labilithrix sp.]